MESGLVQDSSAALESNGSIEMREAQHPVNSQSARSPNLHEGLAIENYPNRSVVARVLLTANPSVYTPVHESITHYGRKKEMIQPHPLV